MPTNNLLYLDPRTRQAWRDWLHEHHTSSPGVWLVFHKGRAAQDYMSYDDAVEEALCFGWIDSVIKRLDEERYARKFSPRKADSKWSDINRRRYADLQAHGLLAPAGLDRPPGDRGADAPRPYDAPIPPYIEERFKADPRAWSFFQGLAKSYQRAYIGWIEAAKREETRERRIEEAVGLLAEGKKLGLK